MVANQLTSKDQLVGRDMDLAETVAKK